jgi:hypothetical protein
VPSREGSEAEHDKAARGRPMRLGWAKLLKRVFNLDLEHCPNCGGDLKVIVAILERPAIEKILNHLGLEARAPPRPPARGQMPPIPLRLLLAAQPQLVSVVLQVVQRVLGRYCKQPLCASLQGFSLHAGVRSAAWERKKLERLCRYITRPALANDRIQVNEAGQVVLKLKTPWRDGTTHQVMSPLEISSLRKKSKDRRRSCRDRALCQPDQRRPIV